MDLPKYSAAVKRMFRAAFNGQPNMMTPETQWYCDIPNRHNPKTQLAVELPSGEGIRLRSTHGHSGPVPRMYGVTVLEFAHDLPPVRRDDMSKAFVSTTSRADAIAYILAGCRDDDTAETEAAMAMLQERADAEGWETDT